MIRKMEPFLIAKSRQAHALLAFDERIQARRNQIRSRDRAGRLLPMPKREAKAREATYLRLKWMNRTGPGGQWQRLTGPLARKRIGPSARYVAGFMDGEGSLMIAKVRIAKGRLPQYHARVSLGNTNRVVLALIQRKYGGWGDSHVSARTKGRMERRLSARLDWRDDRTASARGRGAPEGETPAGANSE